MREGWEGSILASSKDLESGVSGAHVFLQNQGTPALEHATGREHKDQGTPTPEPASSTAAQPGAQGGGLSRKRAPLGSSVC